MTALALAAKAGYVEIVRDLLDQGAYLNVVDKVSCTLILYILQIELRTKINDSEKISLSCHKHRWYLFMCMHF